MKVEEMKRYDAEFSVPDDRGLFVLYSDAKAIEEERDRLKEWKESALEVEKTWDVQAIANEMDLGLGESIRSNILPYIKRLKAELATEKKRGREIDNERVLLGSQLEWIGTVLKGEEVNDFALSFGIVREAYDTKAELAKANKDISDLLSLNTGEHDALTTCAFELAEWKATAGHEAEGLESWKKVAEKAEAEFAALKVSDSQRTLFIEKLRKQCLDFEEQIDRLKAELADQKRMKQELFDHNHELIEQGVALKAELAEARRLLKRYLNETPIGNQPHMIVREVEAALAGEESHDRAD